MLGANRDSTSKALIVQRSQVPFLQSIGMLDLATYKILVIIKCNGTFPSAPSLISGPDLTQLLGRKLPFLPRFDLIKFLTKTKVNIKECSYR